MKILFKKCVYLSVTMILMLFLLLRPGIAANAASYGLLLWFHSLVPVLLPFFILSRLFMELEGTAVLTRWLYPLFRRLFGCSPEGCFAIAAGFLCGYPAGAGIVADLVETKRISREEGSWLLGFCNNVSPAFLAGYCLNDQLHCPELTLPSFLLLYGTPALYGILSRHGRAFSALTTEKKTSGSQISFKIVDACILKGLESILKLGCYVILFSMLARLFSLLSLPSPVLSCVVAGLLEITGGIATTAGEVSLSPRLSFVLVLGFVSFGGLSGTAQTGSMIRDSGLSLRPYLKAKLATTLLILCLAPCVDLLIPLLPALLRQLPIP